MDEETPRVDPERESSPYWAEDARAWGEATADLNALPYAERVAEISRWQKVHDTPDDLDWPTEHGRGQNNP